MKFKSILNNLFLFFLSIYFPLFLYSLFSNFWAKTLKSTSVKIKNNHAKQTILKKKEAIKNNILPIYQPTFSKNYGLDYSIYPIGSLPYTNSYYCDEGLGLVKYKTDRFGLRNSDKKWSKVLNKSNIFVIGDSFIHGACVDNEATIPSNIANKIKINTINLGSGGNGPYEYMALMKSIINPVLQKSDTKNWLVLVFYYNDNIRFKEKSKKLINKSQSIVSTNTNGDVFPTTEYQSKLKSLINKNFPTKKHDLLKGTQVKNDMWLSNFIYVTTLKPVLVKSNEIIKEISSKTNLPNPTNQSINMIARICKNKCKPVITYIPYSSFWYPASERKDLAFKNQIKSLASELKVSFIDGSKVIDRDDLHDYSPKGGHLSPNGNKKIADLIISEIEKDLYKNNLNQASKLELINN